MINPSDQVLGIFEDITTGTNKINSSSINKARFTSKYNVKGRVTPLIYFFARRSFSFLINSSRMAGIIPLRKVASNNSSASWIMGY